MYIALCLYLIDFSKAFDSVDHLKLVNKHKQYGLSHSIITLIVSFLRDRSQYTKVGGNISRIQFINRSIVQGSGIGPRLYIIMILNLKARAATNHMAKYADDATILVPEITSLNIEEEFRFVQKWA